MEIKFLLKLGTQKAFSKHKIKPLLKTKLHIPMASTSMADLHQNF